MARIETWVNCDLKKTVQVHRVTGNLFTLDNQGNLIGVRVFENGQPVTLAGTVNGYCILADGTTVPVAGSRSGNTAYIILPQSAYAVPGIIKIMIKLTESSVITTLAAVIGTVAKSRTDTMVEPSQQVITDWSQQIAAEMQAVEDASAAQDTKIDDLKSAFNNEDVNLNNVDSRVLKAISGDDLPIVKFPIFFNGIRRNTTINSNPDTSDTNTICTQIFHNESDSALTVKVKCTTGFVAVVPKFKTDGTYGGFAPSSYGNDISVSVNAGYYYCVEVRKTPSAAFDKSEFSPDMIEISIGTVENPILPISEKLDDTYNKVSVLSEETKEIKQLAAKNRGLSAWGMRFGLTGESTKIAVPDGFTYLSDMDLELYGDGYNFKCFMDLSDYKNVSGNTLNATPSTIASVLSSATSGDTLILDDGVYGPIVITKSINFIAKNPGKVIFAPIPPTDFDTSGMANVYSFAKTSTPTSAYDISKIEYGVIRELTLVSNTSGLATKGTYNAGSRIYVHMFDDSIPAPSDLLFDNSSLDAVIKCKPATRSKFYFEGITVVGGRCNVIASDTSSANVTTIIMKNCKLYRANTFDSIDMTGCYGLFQNCEAAYAQRDGFNYHDSEVDSSLKSCGLEIDCIGHDNGLRADAEHASNNGSTMHDGGKILRINGLYYRNAGGNVADISSNTKSYNYGCVAFDSYALIENQSGDFWTDTNAEMHLFGCKAVGNKTRYNIFPKSGTIETINTEYDTMYE